MKFKEFIKLLSLVIFEILSIFTYMFGILLLVTVSYSISIWFIIPLIIYMTLGLFIIYCLSSKIYI